MIRFLLTSLTGWVAVLGAGIETALPYLIRANPATTNEANSPARSPNFNSKTRMWPHYWLGYALAALILAHTTLVAGPAMGRSDPAGIWAATLALCLLFLQVALGLILKNGTSNQSQLRRCHFWGMVAFLGLVAVHIIRNG